MGREGTHPGIFNILDAYSEQHLISGWWHFRGPQESRIHKRAYWEKGSGLGTRCCRRYHELWQPGQITADEVIWPLQKYQSTIENRLYCHKLIRYFKRTPLQSKQKKYISVFSDTKTEYFKDWGPCSTINTFDLKNILGHPTAQSPHHDHFISVWLEITKTII